MDPFLFRLPDPDLIKKTARSDPEQDPNPFFHEMDPSNRIFTKMKRI